MLLKQQKTKPCSGSPQAAREGGASVFAYHVDDPQRYGVVSFDKVSGTARLLAIASILAWSGAITAGRLLAYLVP